MLLLIVEAKISSHFEAQLWKEMDSEPEVYEIHQKHPTGVIQIKSKVNNIVYALALFDQLVEELVMTTV